MAVSSTRSWSCQLPVLRRGLWRTASSSVVEANRAASVSLRRAPSTQTQAAPAAAAASARTGPANGSLRFLSTVARQNPSLKDGGVLLSVPAAVAAAAAVVVVMGAVALNSSDEAAEEKEEEEEEKLGSRDEGEVRNAGVEVPLSTRLSRSSSLSSSSSSPPPVLTRPSVGCAYRRRIQDMYRLVDSPVGEGTTFLSSQEYVCAGAGVTRACSIFACTTAVVLLYW